MRLVIYLDECGLQRVDYITRADEHGQAALFHAALKEALDLLDAAARAAAAQIQASGEVLAELNGELGTQNGNGKGTGYGDGSHQG